MLLYFASLFLVFVLLIDLLFYIRIKISFILTNDGFYLYCFSLPILVVCKKKQINLLKKKISLAKLKKTKKEDLKIVESIHVEKLYLNAKAEFLKEYYYLIYPFIGILFSLNEILQKNDLYIESKSEKGYYLYLLIDVKMDNIIKKKIQIRRLKHERASHQ